MDGRDCTEYLPDRNDTDIPENIQWFLSVCELANIWYGWIDRNLDTEKSEFCEGVVDYWWNSDMIAPTMDMVTDKHRLPRDEKRIAYQKGAILGYELAKRFKNE